MGSKRRSNGASRPKAKKSTDDFEYPPFGEKKFWDWHRRAEAKNAKKKAIGAEVRALMDALVKQYTEDDYDPRRDIAWFMEHAGNDLRRDVEREKLAARQANLFEDK